MNESDPVTLLPLRKGDEFLIHDKKYVIKKLNYKHKFNILFTNGDEMGQGELLQYLRFSHYEVSKSKLIKRGLKYKK